ncbi:DNA adenine methylase [Legionella genomosp. 1]|uniref:DNA adenine methylase n=1 Tax=Legionella genomosp. 1 TaxID=1093625 RepID=UPI001056B7AB|nr:DNA adenine methylase [Legionella genomosp. 1]
MTKAVSPLRYPGGKSCLYEIISIILKNNDLNRGHYIEPYAGGCGLALALLYGGHVSDIHINDLDLSIWSFWYCVLNYTEDLISLIETTPITIDEWYKQKNIQSSSNEDILSLAFSTFFLNRTNRSGIIKGAGAIGGLHQTGHYKIDCRFNREELVNRIRRIAKYKNRIHLTRMDAIDFMVEAQSELGTHAFFYIDPPYYNKGSCLYANFYGKSEHKSVADIILKLISPWIVTYDNTEEIKELYKMRRQFSFDIRYSIQTKRIGSELLIASKGLKLPKEITKKQTNKPRHRVSFDLRYPASEQVESL